MKKFALILVFSILFSIPCVAAIDFSSSVDIIPDHTASGVYSVELGEILTNDFDNTVLYAKNKSEKLYPASLVKVMTAIITLEKFSKDELETTEFTMRQDIFDQMYIARASTAGFLAGENVRIIDLLYALMLPSGADAAIMLAEAVSGNETDFVTLMNQKAAEIGAASTNFTNPHGLHDDNQYTTAEDMAVIAEYALFKMNNSLIFREIVSTYSYELPATNKQKERKIFSTNTLLTSKGGGHFEGVKTGNTNKAGSCLITYYKSEDYNIITVILKADSKSAAANETKDVIDNALSKFTRYSFKASEFEEPAYVTPVKKAANGQTELDLYIKYDYNFLIPIGSEKDITIVPTGELSELIAPLTEGQTITLADIKLYDNVLTSTELIIKEDVQRDIKYYIYDTLKIAVPIIIIIFLIVFLLRFMIKKAKKKKIRNHRYNARRNR